MHLIVLRSRSTVVVGVEVVDMDALIPVDEVFADEEVAHGSHASEVVFAGILQHAGVGHAAQHGVGVGRCLDFGCCSSFLCFLPS